MHNYVGRRSFSHSQFIHAKNGRTMGTCHCHSYLIYLTYSSNIYTIKRFTDLQNSLVTCSNGHESIKIGKQGLWFQAMYYETRLIGLEILKKR